MNAKSPLTLEAFAEWCEKQPARAKYDYWSTGNCACVQYAKSLGIDKDFDGLLRDDDGAFWFCANVEAAGTPWSFKSLAKRLRESV